MLVLSRKVGQSIRIKDDIFIYYISQNGPQIKIGIDAPKHYNIVRTELIANDNSVKIEKSGDEIIDD